MDPHRCYERALDLDPRNADAWVARGAAFANQQQLGRAAEDFTMALGALLSTAHHTTMSKTRRTNCFPDLRMCEALGLSAGWTGMCSDSFPLTGSYACKDMKCLMRLLGMTWTPRGALMRVHARSRVQHITNMHGASIGVTTDLVSLTVS